MDISEDALRRAWIDYCNERDGYLADEDQAVQQFSEWLRAVRAAAWEEGHAAGSKDEEDAYWQPGVPEKRNPYGVSLDS